MVRMCNKCDKWATLGQQCMRCTEGVSDESALSMAVEIQNAAPVFKPVATTTMGIKHDSDKSRLDLIPPYAEEEEGFVWAYGEKKYGADGNWKKGIKFKRIIAAIGRHLNAIKKGEDVDSETNRLHAASIRCNAGMLIEFIKTGRTDLDDRE